MSSVLKAGDHFVAARALFGSCPYVLEDVLRKFGAEVTFVDGADLQAWQGVVRDTTKAFFFETVSTLSWKLLI